MTVVPNTQQAKCKERLLAGSFLIGRRSTGYRPAPPTAGVSTHDPPETSSDAKTIDRAVRRRAHERGGGVGHRPLAVASAIKLAHENRPVTRPAGACTL